jgi:small-conductance mechanosensitive channel
LLAVFLSAAALASLDQVRTATERLKQIHTRLDQIETAIAKPELVPSALVELRDETEPLRTELTEIVAALQPIHEQTDKRVKQIGPAPGPDKQEGVEMASEREQQNLLMGEVDAALKQANLLLVRGNQIVENIDRQRRAAFTSRLFERGESFFSPAPWLRAADAIPYELHAIGRLLDGWRERLTRSADLSGAFFAIVLSIAAVAILFSLRAWIHRRSAPPPPAAGGEVPLVPRSHKAVLAVRDTVVDGLIPPAAALAVTGIFAEFGLLPGPSRQIALSLTGALLFFSAGRALVHAVLSPNSSRLRLPSFENDTAWNLHRLVVRAIAITALVLFVNALHRTLTTSVPLTIATNALYAFLIAAVIILALVRSRTASPERDDGGLPPWVRLAGWIAVVVIFGALAAGYIRFASLVAERVVTAAIVLIALTLLLALVDALLGEGLKQDSPRRRALATTFGLRTRTLDLLTALLAGVLRALLVLVALFVVIGTLTTSAIDIASTIDRASFTIQIGQVQIRLGDVVYAVIILLIGVAVTRIFYRWLSRHILPRTELEPSLQNSIATIAGYIGVIAAISLALARLGVNLENIALVAGALSIGIGFGLQSIVSNFVSGLILLTERPIRVGDWIVAGGEEGFVRKISVRSTEIETFERASVILPNSDLITNVVKNWTHSDKLGRLAIPVGVSYDADPDHVRRTLSAIAADHPLLLKDPSPQVLFMNFGESSLDFELRGVVADVNQRLSAASELRFAILRRFREEGIEIPFPQRDLHIRSAPESAAEEPEPEERPKPRKR